MILKKPYAFLIKNFKLLHFILLFFMTYLVYQTNRILNFFYEYLASSQLVSGRDFAGELFNIYMFIVPFLIIIFSIVILSVMYIKKKPMLFYVVNIVIYISLLVIYTASYSTIGSLRFEIVDSRTLRLIRDFLFIAFLLQIFSIIITFVRATGFDIKKFDFGQDLQELEITVEDNEEFEFAVSVDTNKIKRGFRRNFRFSRYVYVENRFLINIVSLIVISIVCFITYLNLGIYNKMYNQGVTFSTTQFIMKVNNSYLTNKDYKLKQLTENNYLVIVELELRSQVYDKVKLKTANAELIVDDKVFYHTNKYRSMLFDLGYTYEDTIIPKEFSKMLLVYEVPKELIKKEMIFKFIDKVDVDYNKLTPKYISIKLKPIDLDQNKKTIVLELGNGIVFNNEVLHKSTLKIDKFEIAKEFKIDYNFCVKTDDCFKSVEFIKPNINTNYDKTLLKIVGELNKDENTNVSGLHNLYNLIEHFGTITYEIDGTVKTQKIGFNEIRPQKVKPTNTYYIEMVGEIEKASKVTLEIKARNRTYRYALNNGK